MTENGWNSMEQSCIDQPQTNQSFKARNCTPWKTVALSVPMLVFLLGTSPVQASENPPFLFEGAKLLASDATTKDGYGASVAIEGDTLLAGAPSAQGCDSCNDGGQAYLLRRQSGAWNEVAVLRGSQTGPNDHFGEAVALAGDFAFIGAYEPTSGHFPEGGDVASGEVYVFERGVEVARLEASDGVRGDRFGQALAATEDTLFVGAKDATPDGGVRSDGIVYVFERGPKGPEDWSEVDQLTAPGVPDGSWDNFGEALAVSGDSLFVTSRGKTVPDAIDQAVWVFERDVDGVWQLQTMLGSSEQEINADFGDAVAIDGDLAVIGAPNADTNVPNTGAAFVFERDTNGEWQELAKLEADIEGLEEYGLAVAISGDVVVVGAGRTGDGRGAGFVYHRDAGGPDQWGLVTGLLASDGDTGDYLGFYRGVTVDGLTIALGAFHDDDACDEGVFCDSGAVYLFGDL